MNKRRRGRKVEEKQGEDSYAEINDTIIEPGTIAETNAGDETSSSSDSEGDIFHDVIEEPVEVQPGEVERPVLGMRRKKARKSVKRGRKPVKKAKKSAKKAKKGAKKPKKSVKKGGRKGKKRM